MLCGCIDIGSNTTRLLVVETDGLRFAPVLEERAFTRLGRASRAGSSIPGVVVESLAGVVAAQVARALAAGVAPDRLRVVATAAVRRAPNAPAVCRALRTACGISVDLIEADEEARLAFAGATRGLGSQDAGELVGVVDVGGGSSELILGTRASGVTWSRSLPFGSGDLADACFRSDPPGVAELDEVRARVSDAFGAAGDALAVVGRPARTFAVGGSAASICRMLGRRFDAAGLGEAIDLLVAAPAEELAREHALDPVRVRLLPAGIVVLAAAAELLGPLEVADGGLREGIVLELAGG